MGRLFYIAAFFCVVIAMHPAFAAQGDAMKFRDMSNNMVQANVCFTNFVALTFWLAGLGGLFALIAYSMYRRRLRKKPEVKPHGYIAAATLPLYIPLFLQSSDTTIFWLWPIVLTLCLLLLWLGIWQFHKRLMAKPEAERRKVTTLGICMLALFSASSFLFPFVQNAMQPSISDREMYRLDGTPVDTEQNDK